jgi:hypothetical protein
MIYHIGAQESEQSVPGFMKNGLDLADLVTMAAPKPYFIGSSLLDFFPIEGTRDAFTEARRFYSMLDAQDNLEIYIAPKPHGFWHDTREKVLRFFCRHLDMEFIEEKNIDYDDLPQEDVLLCTQDGDIDSRNKQTIHRIIQSRATEGYPNPSGTRIGSREKFQSFRQGIRQSAIRILGLEESRILHDVDSTEKRYEENRGWFVTDIFCYSEKYMKIHSILYEKEKGPKSSVLLHIGDIQEEDSIDGYLREFSAVLCVEPRGTGRARMDPGCWFYKGDEIQNEEASYNCNADMLGRSVLGMMVQDVLSQQRLLNEIYQDAELTICGREENAITALFAALVGNIRNVVLNGLLCSYRSLAENRTHSWKPSIFVSGLLKNFDICDLLLALAPARVTVNGFLDYRKAAVKQSGLDQYDDKLYEINR